MANVNIKVGYTVDKTGLNELDKILTDISVKAKLPGEEMNQELQKAASTARQLSTILDKSFNRDLGTVNVAKFNQELSKSHLDMATIKKDLEGVANGSTAFNILGSSVLGANAQIKTANQTLEKMATTLKNTIRYGISSSIFNNFANSFQKAFDYAQDLNQSLNDIRIVTDMSASRMEDFAVEANEASKRLGASTLDYTNAALIYYQQGLSDEEAKARAEVTIKAANVTGQTGQEVSEQLTAVWNGYKVTADEAELYVDKLAAVAASTASDLEELSTGMSKVASAANLMGVDVDQLNAQLATIVSVTRQAPESVGVALKTIYSRMSDIQAGLDNETTLGNYTEKMAQYGINVLKANGELRDMGDVIEEIGNKWTVLSREQQVALSQIMGGARQYNNLLSLFDNWDMYTDALETSSNAMGTLQHQQDIYMQSTEAHLKKLKATWQDLYDSAINDDEVNTGIDLLTNLVQTFDNFIDSFGGGVKTIGALGAVIANVFNKQISGAIANFVQNQTKMEQNINLLEKKRQMLETNASTSGVSGPADQAELAGIQTQLKYAQQIHEVEVGITQEQYNQLTNLQVQMGELEKEAVLLEQEAEAQMQKILGEERYQQYLALELQDQDSINKYWDDSVSSANNRLTIVQREQHFLQESLNLSKKMKLEEDDLANIKESIQVLIQNTNKELAKELKDATKRVNYDKARLSTKEKILKIIQKIVEAQEQETKVTNEGAAAAEKQLQAQEQVDKKRTAQGLLETEFNNTMDYATRATSIAEKVMTITGSLTSLAMTWSSINSLFQTWNDENASLGDKITQTVMTAGMAIPTLISAYKSLAAVQKMMNAEKAKQNTLDAMEATLRATNLKGMSEEEIIETAQTMLKEKKVLLSNEEVATRLKNIGVIKAETAAETANTVAKGAETTATIGLKGAIDALTASMAANPLMWIVTAAALLVGAISAITSAIKANTEEVLANSKANIEEQDKKIAEVEANEQLYKTYVDLYNQYEQGKIKKEDLKSATDNLVTLLGKEKIAVAELTGDYSELNAEIAKARRETAQAGLSAAQSKLTSAETSLTTTARKDWGWKYNDIYEMEFNKKVGLSAKDEKKISDAIMDNIPSSMLLWQDENSAFGLGTKFDAKSIAELYDQIQKVLDLTTTQGSKYFMTQTERNESELWMGLYEWVEKMQDQVAEYKKTLEEIEKYSAEIQALDINFAGMTNFDEFTAGRDQLIAYLKTLDEYTNKSDEEIAKAADAYIGSMTSNTDLFLSQVAAIDALVDKFGEDSREKITEALSGLDEEELKYALEVDDKASLDSLNAFIESVKAKVQYGTSKALATAADNIYTTLAKGDTLSEDQEKSVNKLIAKYAELGQILDKNSNDYLEKLVQIREQEEENAKVAKENIEAGLIDEAVEMSVDADTTEFDDKLANIAKADYEVLVEVKADIQSDFDSLITTMDEMESMASKIGDDFIVAAKDIEELGDAFPGILNNMELLSDGSAQLSAESVQNAMTTAQEEIRLSTESTVEKLQNQQKELEGRQAAAQTIANIAHQITQGEKFNADRQSAINEALNTLKEDNTETTSTFEKDSQKDVADTAALNATAMENSFAAAYDQMSKDSAKWAESAKNNILVATTGQGNITTASINTGWTAKASGGTISTADKGKLSSEVSANSDINWGDVENYYQQLADAYGDAANNIQGKIGEILARNNQLNAASGNIARGLGSSGKSGSGGSGKEADQMDYLEKEIDRYHDVDVQLELIGSNLDKLNKQKDKLFGQDLIDNLNKQLSLLNKQIDTSNEKLSIARNEASELQGKLNQYGVLFNADGTIANYAEAYASQLNYVNSLIAQYNNMSAEAQEGFKDTVEQAKENFDKFTDDIDRYDEVITNLIPDLESDIQSAIDEQIDLQIEKFDMEIEIRLDLAEAERDWNEFKKKIIDGIEEDDILGNAMAKLVDFSSYYKENDTGVVQALRKQVNDTLAQLNQMDTNGWSEVYGDNRTAALDDLKKYYEELMQNLEDVLDLQKEIHESYIDMMDEAQDKFDEQVKSYEMISDLIDHDMKVISLVYGEESYSQLAKYYDKQQQNFNSQLDFQKQQVDFWRQQLDALDEGSDEWENAKEKWADAIEELNKLIEESIENLQDKYLNAINLIFQNLNNKVTDGLGLDYVEEEWNLINKNADQYLDTINSLYGIQKLENKYLDAIDNIDSVSAQRQLKEIMDEELANLRERDRLTEYDVERANKRYEIALKQIALQEAQQNKTKMRLRRDSQGNYRYEYVSDNDQAAQLQDELDDMYNSLYNFDKARYQDNLNQLYDTWVEFQEKMAEAAQINDPELRAEKELLLREQYGELINGLVEQNETVRNNLQESAFDDLTRLYDTNVENFQNMADEEKNTLMEDLVPYWESGTQHMADVFAGEGGFLGVCQDALEQLHNATKDYEDGLVELEQTGRISFEEIGQGIDENIDRTQQLLNDNGELINSYEQELNAIANVITQLDSLVDKYNSARDAAIAASKAAYEYWSEQQRQAAGAANAANSGSSGSGNANQNSNDNLSSSNAGGAGTSAGNGDGNLLVGESATYSGKYYYDSYGTSPIGSKYSGVANGVVVDRITNNPYGIHIHSADGKYPDLGWIKKSQLSGYDTGGYTGTWGNDGRLALLHQKELVLNKEDTANMLNAISIMRNITNMLGSSVLGKLAAATAGNVGTNIGNDVLEQNVHIDAQFPNVKDSREIEEALNNLVNMASMRANRR